MSATDWQLIIGLVISIGAIILLTRYLNLHAFFSLLIASVAFGLIIGKPIIDILNTMQSGFGSLLQQIGFLVAIGSCLGIMLEKTRAMEAISHHIIQFFGAKHAILGVTIIGVLVGIPVFCDSGFIILSRLIPSIASQASIQPAQLSLALSTALYTTHTLVPPTPGPLSAAANLGITENISSVILVGIITSIPVALVSFYFSKRLGKNISTSGNNVQQPGRTDYMRFSLAILPLILPIILIAGSSLPKIIPGMENFVSLMQIIGNPVVALSIGLMLSFVLLTKDQLPQWPVWISDALKDAGVILLITGAGGAFGSVIKTSGIDLILREHLSGSQSAGIVFLFIGYLIAAVLKTAQGSTTSAMIIASSLLGPLTVHAGFSSPMELAILVVAIGGGAMTVSHANDSYFWVVSQFGGISARDAFRSFTVLTLLQGLTALFSATLLFLLL
jgi:GntP family gluconate:H+ symporter